MKQRCITEFLSAEEIAPTNIHRCFLNIDGDKLVDVSTVRQWVVHFSSNSSYSGSSLLMEVFMSVAFKFLFITDKTFLL